jgi:hypothetical protein
MNADKKDRHRDDRAGLPIRVYTCAISVFRNRLNAPTSWVTDRDGATTFARVER